MRAPLLKTLFVAAFACGLSDIVRADTKEEAAERRTTALRQRFDSFQKIEPPARDPKTGLPQWRTLTLNERALVVDGVRYDGFRFDAVRKLREDFIWCFEHPENVDSWYILSEAGGIPPISSDDWTVLEKSFVDRNASTIDPSLLDERPELSLIPQAVRGERLLSGKMYLIWFAFTDDKPATLRYAYEFRSLPRSLRRPKGQLRAPRTLFIPYAEHVIARRFGIELNANSAGPIVGVLDFYIKRDEATGEIVVPRVDEGGDADVAGVKKGDVLLSIGDVELKGKTDEQLYPHFGGKIGEVVPITVRREGSEKPLKLLMSRGFVNYEKPATAPAAAPAAPVK